MHDLLQEMGKEIVCREAPQEPGRRSRLWNDMDIFSILKNNTGTEFIEGMVINSPPHKEELNAEAFSKMKRLRLIKICNVQLPQGLNYLSNELRMMDWCDYPLKSMPISFRPTNLVELIMPRNCIEQLPTGFAICKRLHSLPREINMESLKNFILFGCSRLRNFLEIGRDMTRLLELYLDGTAIEELPSSFKHLTGLILLNLQECENISSFPQVICSLTSLKILNLLGCNSQPPKSWHFPGLSFIYATHVLWKNSFFIAQHPELEPINLFMPRSFSGLRSLASLDLSDCNLLDGAFPGDLGCLSSVRFLNLSKSNFTLLPDSIFQLPKLRVLYVDNCSRLQALPNLPLSAQFVMARGCASLQNYNEVVVWTPGETGYTSINCLSLVEDKECKIMEVSLQEIHFQPLWQIYMEEQIHQSEGFYSILPQTEIPGWFNRQSLGSSVPILLPCPLYDNNSWSGIALCAIFVVQNASDVFLGQGSTYFHEFMFHLDTDRDCVDFPLVFNIPKDKFCIGSFGLWLYILRAWFKDHLDECSCISTSLKTNSLSVEIKSTNPKVEVEMCGIRPVYKQDVKELAQTLVQGILECSNAFYYRYLLHQVNKLPSCNHEKYFGCYFTFQRRPQSMTELPSSTENVEEEGCT
ncbi:hypothetical protein SO802_004173 [Lithocarpus litseifolius]|uniref:Uncharacterized protein n=1 Tax=Lithocarpus litseifolius TaxID=425828 RepID=A0AAW2E3X4_9ROSI